MEDEFSPCRALCAEDCWKSLIRNACPDSCDVCLYWERWLRNDCQWNPCPGDKCYNHYTTREIYSLVGVK